MAKKKKKDKKKEKDEVIVTLSEPEPVIETPPEPEPAPEPPKFLPWRTCQVESTEQIIDLFNALESEGLDIIEYDFEYNHRRGVIDLVYKVRKAGL